jgi:LPS O-antigen subunit length determinant protein (WzzB/FepE family)
MPDRSVANTFDFPALWYAIKSRRLVLFFTVLCFLVLGLLYSATITPRYRAEVILLPPTEKELVTFILASIPIHRSDSPEIYDLLDVNEIFKAFKMNLASRSHQGNFLEIFRLKAPDELGVPTYKFDSGDGFGKRVRGSDFASLETNWNIGSHDNGLLGSIRSLVFPDSNTLSIVVNTDKTSSRRDLVLTVVWEDPQSVAVIANEFADYVNKKTSSQVMDLVTAGLEIRGNNVRDLISSLRALANADREDNIVKLQEAIQIAKTLNIRKPTRVFGDYTIVNITPPAKFFVDPGINAEPYIPDRKQRYLPLYGPGDASLAQEAGELRENSPPLYSRGWEALEEELRILENRSNPDPFISNLRHLQTQLAWIESIDVRKSVTSTIVVGKNATTPSVPSGPTPFVILLLFLLCGLFVGIFLASAIHVFTIPKTS